MSVEYQEGSGIMITVETDLFYPQQTILGFTLEAVRKYVPALGEDEESRRVTGRERRLDENIYLARRQAAFRLLNAPLMPAPTNDATSVIDKALFELPYTLASVVDDLRDPVLVDVKGDDQEEVNHALQDVRLMRNSGMHVAGSSSLF